MVVPFVVLEIGLILFYYDLIGKKYQKCQVCQYPAKINSKECPRCGTTLKEISNTWDHPETLSPVQKWSIRKRVLIGSGLLIFGIFLTLRGAFSGYFTSVEMVTILCLAGGFILVINGLSHHYKRPIIPSSPELSSNTKSKIIRIMIVLIGILVLIPLLFIF